MSSPPLNILVYAGPGATALSTHQALHTLRALLTPAYSISTITPSTLLREPWAPTCALLVFPGGADLPYCAALDGAGTRLIRQYVRRGGRFLGFCAGGYFGSARCEFEVGRGGGIEVVGRRELALFPGTCRGGAFGGFEYKNESGARAARLRVGGRGEEDEKEAVVYYNGGGIFVNAAQMEKDETKGVEVLASYAEDTDVDGGEDGGKAAIVYCKVGSGHAVLTGPHPEFDPKLLQPQPDVLGYEAVRAALAAGNESRIMVMKLCLTRMGLTVSERPAETPVPTSLHLSALDCGYVDELLCEIVGEARGEGGRTTLDAELDVFCLREAGGQADEKPLVPAEPNAESKAPEEMAKEEDKKSSQPSDQGHKEPPPVTKARWDLIAHTLAWPMADHVSRWDHELYFSSLRGYQLAQPDQEAVRDWGRALLYGDVVTSTNTLVEKNPKLLSALPTGFTLAASAQLAGRGRGGNAWVSPKGSLIFSVVVNHPVVLASSTHPLPFVQYVAAIAVVEAIQGYGPGYEDVPVRLKWPNDIYARDPRSDPKKPEFLKIGGILTNCVYNFSTQTYQLVVGIGVNTNNAQPTTSLSALLPPGLPAFRRERLLASIMTRFGAVYDEFLCTGFRGDLERRYYRHWLHTGQLVTVDGEVAGGGGSGPWSGRVLGVTRDWGMLRVEEVEKGPDGVERGTRKVWELQSDENSFDFWRGLLRRKV